MMMRVSRRFLGCLLITAAVFVLILSPSDSTTGDRVWSAEPVETIPDENDNLTLRELRWCVFEDVRLGSEGDELDVYREWEVDSYNARVNQYNHRCSNKSYYERDKSNVDNELTIAKRQYLQGQGALRIKKARLDRENKRVYVNGEEASVLAAPEDTAPELKRVPRWGELIKTGRVQGEWHEVEWQTPSLDKVLKFGWVLGGLLERGSGSEARFVYCEKHKQGRAKHGKIVRRGFELHSANEFNVKNGLRQDAYVKLVRKYDNAVVSLYVVANQTASLEGVPAGAYDIIFATGSKFSHGCDSFSQRGGAQKFAEGIEYDHTALPAGTLTLHSSERWKHSRELDKLRRLRSALSAMWTTVLLVSSDKTVLRGWVARYIPRSQRRDMRWRGIGDDE